jgi:hypothetical protein
MRAARVVPDLIAERFAAAPSIEALSSDIAKRGFLLTPKVRLFARKDGTHTVRLVWRHRALDSSVVLTVRL